MTWPKLFPIGMVALLAALTSTDRQMAHVLNGVGPGERLQMVGYPYTTYAENVAYNYGYDNPVRAVMDSWIKSSGHFRNMVNPQVTEIGVGFAVAGNGSIYYCQVFGAR